MTLTEEDQTSYKPTAEMEPFSSTDTPTQTKQFTTVQDDLQCCCTCCHNSNLYTDQEITSCASCQNDDLHKASQCANIHAKVEPPAVAVVPLNDSDYDIENYVAAPVEGSEFPEREQQRESFQV